MKISKRQLIFLGIIIFVTLIFIMAHLSYKKIIKVVEVYNIYENIFVNEINIGGLKKSDAQKKIYSELQAPIDKKIIKFTDTNNEYEFSFKDFHAAYNITSAVQKAYDYARDGSILKRYEKIVALKKSPLKITAEYGFDNNFVKSKLSELESKVYIKPINASAKRINNNFVVTAGKNGRTLNVDATLPAVIKLLQEKCEGKVELIFDLLVPKYNESAFKNVKDILGSYTTYFNNVNLQRNANIINAAQKINNKIVYPNEIFSTNDVLKPFTAKNGYKNAPVIIEGKLVDALGGGICQVSTALYNALLYSELEITERRNHSLKVGYVDYGYDATLAGNYIDLKFKNTTQTPLLLESIINENENANSLRINVYGAETRNKNHSIKFENSLVETIDAPPETIIYTDELEEGTKKVETKSKKGYRYKLYKIIYENGAEKQKVLINSSYYKPMRGTIKVGTKKS